MNKKLLVVQFRTDITRDHEQSIFHQEFPDLKDQIEFVSAVEQEFPTNLSDYFAIIFGGSGEFMLHAGSAGAGSWREKTFDFIEKIKQSNVPTLGICFGFQILALSQGAQITDDPNMREVGTFPVYLTDDGKRDEYFENLPDNFMAQLGHKETIINFPNETFIKLGGSERVDCNSYRIKDTNIRGVLYHPELNQDRMRTRLDFFPNYLEGKDILEVIKQFEDTPEAAEFLQHFVHHSLNKTLTNAV